METSVSAAAAGSGGAAGGVGAAFEAPGIDEVRAAFPALAGGEVYLDNAGGSQAPRVVAERMRDFMLSSYVAPGAGYTASRAVGETVRRAHEFAGVFMNARGAGRVALGPSATLMCMHLAEGYARRPDTVRDEVVVAENGHESNIGPWLRLAGRGFRVRLWRADPETGECSVEGLKELLSARTRVVAVTHVSNLLGRVVDVAEVARLAHDAGAHVVVDSVAYASHRAIDVREMGADWCVYSTYKVYGPHMAAMFGTDEAFDAVGGVNHAFVESSPKKLEPGGACPEGCAGLLGTYDYLAFLASARAGVGFERGVVERAFARMEGLEAGPRARLIGWLASREGVRLLGPSRADPDRVATVAFTCAGRSSKEVAEAANGHGLGVRHGSFYAPRLASALGLDPEDGAVRVSLVHYNTLGEVERFISFLDACLNGQG